MKADALKNKAITLRKKGFSFKEINEKLGISKSTASLWLRDIKLSEKAKKRIYELGVVGRNKASITNDNKRKLIDKHIKKKVEGYFTNFSCSKNDYRIATALLYWCEGTKHKENSSVSFINADPEMIKYFLYVFRNSFEIEEKKLRGLVHLHEYHNEEKQLKFWSDVTKIPISQFNKSYLKKNTGKNKKENYPGCISIRYSDVKIYKELMFIIKRLMKI